MKFITPEDREPRNGLAVRPRNARDAAIEKERSHYIKLKCGHYTTWELVQLYSCCCPKGKEYCDLCGKYVPRMPKPKIAPLAESPLF